MLASPERKVITFKEKGMGFQKSAIVGNAVVRPGATPMFGRAIYIAGQIECLIPVFTHSSPPTRPPRQHVIRNLSEAVNPEGRLVSKAMCSFEASMGVRTDNFDKTSFPIR
jgi:hypothetical protein